MVGWNHQSHGIYMELTLETCHMLKHIFQCVFCWLMLFLGDLWGKFSQFLQSQRRASCWDARQELGDSMGIPKKKPRQGDPRKWLGIGGGDCVREVKWLSLRYIHINTHTHIYLYIGYIYIHNIIYDSSVVFSPSASFHTASMPSFR